MDKNAIKKYAVWARNELIARVTQKAEQYEITAKKTTPKDADSIGGRLLTEAEKNQRKALIEKIQVDGFEQVMEEVAYTWFNRFTALRFMEVNNYLPSHTRVFTNESGEFKPQILADAIQLDLEGLNMDKVFELKDANKTEELYKYLLITQCNALSDILPRMFQKIEHYTELLLPDYLLREGSVIEQMIALIPEEDWTDQVQIIGWMYQFYNTELKAKVFDKPKSVKISKTEIPAATELFTPDWIVRYMVENSLGRLWLEGHPNDALKSEWKYYLDEAEQEADVQKQLDEIRKEYAALKPEEIRCIDPCMGSGHILCYMFDVLVKIYEDYGYTAREAAGYIVEKNLWGLDIDERAAQLSYFAVMMKARQYDSRFLTRGCQPHVYAIEESNGITSAPMHDMGIELSQEEYGNAVKQAMRLVEETHDAKEYGSLINVAPGDWGLLRRFAIPRGNSEGQMRLDIHGEIAASEKLQDLINIGEALSQKYHVVVTNPPYMGSKQGMNDTLKKYLSNHYDRSRSDLYGVFMEVSNNLAKENGYIGMINQHGWMFLSSFSKLRADVVKNDAIINMVHLGTHAFEEIGGEVVQTTTFVLQKNKLNYRGKYIRVTDISDPEKKRQEVINVSEGSKKNLFEFNMSYFSLLPDNLIGYWISTKVIDIFTNEKALTEIAKPRQGLSTSDNDRFLRLWFETDIHNIGFGFEDRESAAKSGLKWFPYNKGGEFRKWYGNNNYVINWQYDGAELREWADYLNTHGTSMGRLVSQEFYYKKGLTWSGVGATRFGVRCYPSGMLFDVGANGLFVDDSLYYYLAGFLNTKIANEMIKVLNPTINTGSGTVGKLPIIIDESIMEEVNALVKENVSLVKEDWDSYETSWDFKRSPLLGYGSVKEAYENWSLQCDCRFNQLKENEERLNSIFMNVYGLQNEFSSEVNDADVSIRKADREDSIKALISYAVGCMFGRYSLDSEGLVYAGGKWNPELYQMFKPDKDAIIPICDDEYFEDDIVGRFVHFIEVAYDKNCLDENLKYIADVLGGTGTAREIIRNYFMTGFYTDHCARYSITGSGKRPIYWLFDSGKNNGFKCLIYAHRYQPDTIARIRTDYVHEQQSRYRTAISDLEQRINGSATSDRVRLNKRLTGLQAQASEIKEYEEKIHHLADQMIKIDLDDGVRANYDLFKDVLAKIK